MDQAAFTDLSAAYSAAVDLVQGVAARYGWTADALEGALDDVSAASGGFLTRAISDLPIYDPFGLVPEIQVREFWEGIRTAASAWPSGGSEIAAVASSALVAVASDTSNAASLDEALDPYLQAIADTTKPKNWAPIVGLAIGGLVALLWATRR